MSDDEIVDIRLLALRRQQERRQSRVSSGHSAYEATPVKEYTNRSDSASTRRSSYSEVITPRLLDEDIRIGRMHVPPLVRCECNGMEATALISSSETTSSMSPDFVRRLRISDQVIPDTTFNSLSSQQRESKGKVKYIDLCIGSWQQVAQFNMVENYLSDITLGIDFLRKSQSILSFEDSSLVVGGSRGERISFLSARDATILIRRNVNVNKERHRQQSFMDNGSRM